MKPRHLIIAGTIAGLLGFTTIAQADHKNRGHRWQSNVGRDCAYDQRRNYTRDVFRRDFRRHYRQRNRHWRYRHSGYRSPYRGRDYGSYRGYRVNVWTDGLRLSWYEPRHRR